MRQTEMMRIYALLMPRWPSRECGANALHDPEPWHVARNMNVDHEFWNTSENVARMANSLRNEGFNRCGTVVCYPAVG